LLESGELTGQPILLH